MFIKILIICFVTPLVPLSFKFVKEEMNLTATTQMISRLIYESKRSTVNLFNADCDILQSFLRLHNLQITVKLEDLKNISISENRKINAMLVQLHNYDEFERLHSLIQIETFLYDGHFLIIYENGNVDEIEKIFSKLWKMFIYNVNVLVTSAISSNLVSLFTFMPFNNQSCNNTNMIQINEFDKISMKWKTNVFFPKKFKKLNGCMLRAGSFENKPAFIINNSLIGPNRYSGINVDVVNLLSNMLNFTPNITENEAGVGSIYKNKTATGLLKKVLTNEFDFIFGASLQLSRMEALTVTKIIYTDKLVLVTPPPFPMNPIKAIFLPFTFTSWISIGIVVFIAFCVVTTLQFTPKIFHDFVIGKNVKGSTLNIWNVLFGGTQRVLPRSSLPRFLLVKFIIFTLIMRSLYQGKVFDILKRDLRSVELDTIDKFIEHEFTFYVYESLAARIEGSKIMERSYVISYAAGRSYAIMTLNPSFNGVVFYYMSSVLYENLINHKNFTLRICKETVHTNLFVFYFTKNFYLVNEFNDLISNFQSAGLISQVMSKYVNVNSMQKIEKRPPSALTFDNIKGFLELCVCGLVLAFLSFLCEILSGVVKQRKQNMIVRCAGNFRVGLDSLNRL